MDLPITHQYEPYTWDRERERERETCRWWDQRTTAMVSDRLGDADEHDSFLSNWMSSSSVPSIVRDINKFIICIAIIT